MRSPRRGVSLIEVLFASSILAVLAVSFFQSHLITTRQTAASEAMLNSGVLAQLVIERIKAKAAMNPRFFRDLMGPSSHWSGEGTVVDPASVKAADGAGRRLSTFFEFLFSRAAPQVYDEANQASISAVTAPTPTGMTPAELGSLVETFQDYEVAVEIHDEASPGTGPADPPVPGAIKRVVVTVSRLSVSGADGKDPLAFTVTARLTTPADSLPAEGMAAVAKRFEGKPLEDQWKELFATATTNPYLLHASLRWPLRRLLADAYLVLAAANNEALQLEGIPACVPGSTVLDATENAQFIESWIQKFSKDQAFVQSSSKCELVKLHVRKATVIFDTFRRLRLPLEHLLDEMLGKPGQEGSVLGQTETFMSYLDKLGPEYRTVSKKGKKGKKPLKKRVRNRQNLKMVKTAFPEYLICSYLYQFFRDPGYAQVVTRPLDYPARLEATVRDLRRVLESHLDQDSGITPYERMRSAQLYTEAIRVQRIQSGATTLEPAVQQRLEGLALATAPAMADLAEYLAGGELYDRAQLEGRHADLALRLREMKELTARFRELVREFQPGSRVDTFLLAYRRFFTELRMDSARMLEQLESLEEFEE